MSDVKKSHKMYDLNLRNRKERMVGWRKHLYQNLSHPFLCFFLFLLLNLSYSSFSAFRTLMIFLSHSSF